MLIQTIREHVPVRAPTAQAERQWQRTRAGHDARFEYLIINIALLADEISIREDTVRFEPPRGYDLHFTGAGDTPCIVLISLLLTPNGFSCMLTFGVSIVAASRTRCTSDELKASLVNSD
ncbi:jg887 [Pararge aegeria aegeria]|uniref:Jg887 protein n=1 Tax=Pararge aegeria aegeria TaxID=348720 RepID=A0A8S4QCV6_9NEOP|nr:jg887 [Pararge aegeria aegeria]